MVDRPHRRMRLAVRRLKLRNHSLEGGVRESECEVHFAFSLLGYDEKAEEARSMSSRRFRDRGLRAPRGRAALEVTHKLVPLQRGSDRKRAPLLALHVEVLRPEHLPHTPEIHPLRTRQVQR